MVDPRDRHTATLPGIKEIAKRGRPTLFSEAMTPAQRKAKQRREQDSRILDTPWYEWSESDCMRVLTTKKFSGTAFGAQAWQRLGELKGYEKSA